MMPCMDGFTFVGRLAPRGARGCLCFSFRRARRPRTWCRGFETGGNDYLRKPFAMSELIVRVRALAGRAGVGKARTERVFELGRMRFDAERQRLSCDGVVTELSARESEVLQYLCRNAGEIVPMKTLLVNIWGDDSFFNARSLHVFITRLRHRLVADPSIQLVNVRGSGGISC